MKLKLALLFLLIISLISCITYYDKREYKKLYDLPRSIEGIELLGYYAVNDSSYNYWNYRRTENGPILPQDSMKIVYYNFIILYENGDAFVNLSMRYDGLHHHAYDDVAPTGANTKDSAHAQFLKDAYRLGLFNENCNWKYQGFYNIENDSIVITYYQPISDGKKQLTQLCGIILNESTFQINHKKTYETSPFDKTIVKGFQRKFYFEKLRKSANN